MKRWVKRAAKKAQRAAELVAARSADHVATVSDVTVTRNPSHPRESVDVEAIFSDRRNTQVTYANGTSNPFALLYGHVVPNADPVVLKYGSADNVAIYKGMWRRHPWLVGICDQRVEAANRPRVIVPNDPSDPQSVKVTKAARDAWRRVPETTTVTARWFKYARFLGYGAVEKVFSRDTSSGLIYAARLIARESENVRVRKDGTPVWLSYQNPFEGDPIPPRKMMFLRGGTNDTFYGEAELQHIYPVTYWLERSIELAFDSIEEFGRAIPHVKMPRLMDYLSEDERAKVRAWAAAYHRSYLETPHDGTSVEVEMMGGNLASSGAVGRPELSLVEVCITWAYIRILRVMQTMNKTGSTGQLEQARLEIIGGAARPDSQIIDDGLNQRIILPSDQSGWLADFNDLNFPDTPEEQLCRFETPTMSVDDILAQHKMAMEMIEHGAKPSKQWYHKTSGVEEAIDEFDVLGSPREEPIGTNVNINQNPPPSGNAPQAQATPPKKVAVATEDGEILYFDADAKVSTNLGPVPAGLLQHLHGVEITTCKTKRSETE